MGSTHKEQGDDQGCDKIHSSLQRGKKRVSRPAIKPSGWITPSLGLALLTQQMLDEVDDEWAKHRKQSDQHGVANQLGLLLRRESLFQ